MIDQYGRRIDYLRVSVTDRCNLRCVYCMPEKGIELASHNDILTYDEILRLVRIMAELGIRKVRLTGGEPLVRLNIAELIARIKDLEGIEKVVMTTNGVLLKEQIGELLSSGLDGVNISLDTLNEDSFQEISRRTGLFKVLDGIKVAEKLGLNMKINCVPTKENLDQIPDLINMFSQKGNIPIRFIELMPIGQGRRMQGVSQRELLDFIEKEYGAYEFLPVKDLDGPAKYIRVEGLRGKIGFISAISNCFCESCNRLRLSSKGFLKTCLQYNSGISLKEVLDRPDSEIRELILTTVLKKPKDHKFKNVHTFENREEKGMSQIGG